MEEGEEWREKRTGPETRTDEERGTRCVRHQTELRLTALGSIVLSAERGGKRWVSCERSGSEGSTAADNCSTSCARV